jgi:uncharacterized protein (UPF0333 family)
MLSITAIVVVHIATAYPTIVAVSALFKKTESKNANETWARPHPNKDTKCKE